MLQNKNRILNNTRMCQSVFGMSKDEIERLLPTFEECLIAYRYKLKPKSKRKRKVGGGRKGDLPTALDKLLYILIYLKVYPTYDILSVLSNHQRSKCGDSIQFLLPILEMTLGRNLALPKRKARSMEEVFEKCPELKDVFIDGTERRIQRPKNIKKRNRLYSGKKKSTTKKTIVLSNEKKGILYITPSRSGRRHDKRTTDKYGVARYIPKNITLWTDTGFQGLQHVHENTIMPKKRRKNCPLTQKEKQENKVISGLRIVSEHAIGGFKRFKATSDVYRNKLPNMDDAMNRICAGLWNLHLGQTV